MHGRLRGRDDAGLDQLLHARMVDGAGGEFAIANQIQARIAGVCPAGLAVLHDATDHGGARALEHVVLIGEGDDGAVRGMDGGLEEFFRPAQRGARFLLKAVGHGTDGHFGGDLTAGVAAHAVGDDHHQHVFRVRIRQPVLVDLAAADEAVLEDREAHYRCRLPARTISPAMEAWRAGTRLTR